MNRRIGTLILGSLLLPLGCLNSGGTTGPREPTVLEAEEFCSGQPFDDVVASFDDENLETAIRETVTGFPFDGTLFCGLVSEMPNLIASSRGISSLVGIQNLTSLVNLDLGSNRLTNLGSLSGLTRLRFLRLHDNTNLRDIQALLDNPGLGAGSTVHLTNTNVSCADVALLEAKGGTVTSDCP